MSPQRPSVSIVMPFLGSPAEADAALDALASLELGPGDEIVAGDNSPGGVLAERARRRQDLPLTVVEAPARRSSYYARNVAARRTANEWLLFVDADCRPAPSLLDDYFRPPPPADVGALAGGIAPARDQDGALARWAASRRVLDQEASMKLPGGPAAATANLLVRRAAWAEVGGFLESRSGADIEFCWRLQDAGHRLEHRPDAVVEHLHRETLGEILRQFGTYSAGNAWQNRRRPGSTPRPRLLRPLLRALVGTAGFALSGRLDRARSKALDGLVAIAQSAGYLRGNSPGAAAHAEFPDSHLVVFTDRFPVLTEQFVVREIEALAAAGRRVRVEAVERPARPTLGAADRIEASWLEDEGAVDRGVALAAVAARHPLRALADLLSRHRLDPDERMPLRALAPAARRLERGGERHLHVHFAALAAANALRVGRLAGVPVSITPHAHDIYSNPRGLAPKLGAAVFATTVCRYNLEHLRRVAPPPARSRIHELPIGIDAEELRRAKPPPSDRSVLAVGRLVPQKGFSHLVEAAAILERDRPLDRLLIAGGGPLREELASLAAARGIAGRVELTGPLSPERVRALMEGAAVLAVPSVVAADGSRDALPVVVLEALALELPVVASDEVGLPEVVRPQWGRLVPPGDPEALAEAIDELLSLSPQERAELAAAGREFVRETRDVGRQAARLLELIDAGAQSIGTR